ncbi:MAG: hypothetical protein A4E69_03287 [Syntrophus sp. PtaB.Bin138]|nr:MAG: hypothetical protein A4E69_03287 [Syntrophus sp. PtaB.Bin138]
MDPASVFDPVAAEKDLDVFRIGYDEVMDLGEWKHPVFQDARCQPEDRRAALLPEMLNEPGGKFLSFQGEDVPGFSALDDLHQLLFAGRMGSVIIADHLVSELLHSRDHVPARIERLIDGTAEEHPCVSLHSVPHRERPRRSIQNRHQRKEMRVSLMIVIDRPTEKGGSTGRVVFFC